MAAPCWIRMDAVRLIERRLTGHLVEQERDERHAVVQREVAIGLPERGGVLGAVVRRRFHAREDHDDALRARGLDDLPRGSASSPRPTGREARRWRRARRRARGRRPAAPNRDAAGRRPTYLPTRRRSRPRTRSRRRPSSPAASPGTACVSTSPSPAVRLSPRTTTFGRVSSRFDGRRRWLRLAPRKRPPRRTCRTPQSRGSGSAPQVSA